MSRATGIGLILGMVMVVVPATAGAQPAAGGYLFAAPGVVTFGGCCATGMSTLNVGGGAELLTPGRRIGVAAEIGYLGPIEMLGAGVGAFSLNGVYYGVGGRTSRLLPFVTGGYTSFFRNGQASPWNVGGGIEYRYAHRVGLRIEVRDHIRTNFGTTGHFLGLRAGVTLR